MAPIIGLALSLGPTVIRNIAKLKGGKTEEIGNSIANVIEAVQGKPHVEKQKAVAEKIALVDPKEFSPLAIELEKIKAEQAESERNYDLNMHREQQTTIRTSKDLSGVRPKIADRHSIFVFVYILLFELAQIIGYGSGSKWEIATLIASPTLAWFGFRTWDKFSKQGASF